jgi:hypothetical protein
MSGKFKVFVAAALVMLLAGASTGCGKPPFDSVFKQASTSAGVEFPRPRELPEKYTITDAIISRQNEVTVTIQKGVLDNITLRIWLTPIPLKLLNETVVNINGEPGYFLNQTDDNLLKWDLVKSIPLAKDGGLFELTMIASQDIPVNELILIAESIGWQN